MKIYYFNLSTYSSKVNLSVEDYDVEEKEKTYTCKGRRFLKSELGKAIGYYNNECFLLENDKNKALDILIPEREKEIKKLEERLEEKKKLLELIKAERNSSIT